MTVLKRPYIFQKNWQVMLQNKSQTPHLCNHQAIYAIETFDKHTRSFQLAVNIMQYCRLKSPIGHMEYDISKQFCAWSLESFEAMLLRFFNFVLRNLLRAFITWWCHSVRLPLVNCLHFFFITNIILPDCLASVFVVLAHKQTCSSFGCCSFHYQSHLKLFAIA